jgi:hypothetical protein
MTGARARRHALRRTGPGDPKWNDEQWIGFMPEPRPPPSFFDNERSLTMTTITVFDPAPCCPTGVCGPRIDPALAQFADDLDWLKSQGVTVRRFNLAREPLRFAENAAVRALLDRSGAAAPCLPSWPATGWSPAGVIPYARNWRGGRLRKR